jgi:hypothetical protein
MSLYRDKFGLITQTDNDGGDSANRHGSFVFLSYLLDDRVSGIMEHSKLRNYIVESEQYVRHPDKTKWYSNPNNFSRDQQTPLVLACGAAQDRYALKHLFAQHIKRFGFYQNTHDSNGKRKIPDIMSPEHLGYYIRSAWQCRIHWALALYPLLLLGDLFMLLGIVLTNLKADKDMDYCDDINGQLALMQANISLPTPITLLCNKLFKTRRVTYAAILAGSCTPEVEAMRPLSGTESSSAWYFRPEANAPDMAPLYIKALRKLKL